MIKRASLWIFTIAVIAINVGCGGDRSAELEGRSVLVSFGNDPLADVQVNLHDSSAGPVISSAVTDGAGIARFAELPNPEPEQYWVSLISISDGGWILDNKYLEAQASGLQLGPIEGFERQTIRLPSDAVRPL